MEQDDWSHLDSPVQGCTGKGVGVLRVEDHLHDIVGVALKHLRASPTLHKPLIVKMLMLYFSEYKCNRQLLSEHLVCSFADTMYCVLELLLDVQAVSRFQQQLENTVHHVCKAAYQMLIHSLTG